MLTRVLALLRMVVAELGRHPLTRMAAALAFFALFALPALAVVVLLLGGAVYGDEAAREGMLQHVQTQFGSGAKITVASLIDNTPRPARGDIVTQILGLGALLFGATASFHQIQAMLNAIWTAERRRGLGRVLAIALKRLTSFLMVIATGLALLAYLVASTALSAFPDELGRWLEPDAVAFATSGLELLLSFLLMTLNFVLLYEVLPDARVPWRSALYGALLAAALFSGGRYLVEVYIRHAPLTSAFGKASSLVVTLIWFYAAALVLLLGAVWSRAHARWRDEWLTA